MAPTLRSLILSERLLPGALANGRHGTVRLDASGHSQREMVANPVRSVLQDVKVYADGPRGATVCLDEADVREWVTTNCRWRHSERPPWDTEGRFYAQFVPFAARDVARRIERALPGLRAQVADGGRVIVRVRP